MTQKQLHTHDSLFAEEALITDTQLALQNSLQIVDFSRRALALKTGVTDSYISQFFGPSSNPTLKTVARFFDAIGDACVITSRRLETRFGGFWTLRWNDLHHVGERTFSRFPLAHAERETYRVSVDFEQPKELVA